MIKITPELIDQAHTLVMKGLEIKEVKKRLHLTERQWHLISTNKYYKFLLLYKFNKEGKLIERLEEVKDIELELFSKLEERKTAEKGTEHMAALNIRINELQKIYSGFNIYNF